jgi:hypothetical protein
LDPPTLLSKTSEWVLSRLRQVSYFFTTWMNTYLFQMLWGIPAIREKKTLWGSDQAVHYTGRFFLDVLENQTGNHGWIHGHIHTWHHCRGHHWKAKSFSQRVYLSSACGF